jgi:hypothetical protein
MKAYKGIKLEQLSAGFERGILALDDLRLMQLGDGLRLQGALNQVQTREFKRLERKYGKDHPRMLNAAAKIELGKEHMQAISIVHTTVSEPRPDPGDGWAVDGFVRTANGDPVGGVTVAAYDRRGRWYEEFGYDCTKEDGHFMIVVEKLPDKLPRPVYMRASKGKKPFESNEVQVAPEPKSSDRVEIIIGDTGSKGDCMPPPGGKGEPGPPKQPRGGKEKPKAVKKTPLKAKRRVSKKVKAKTRKAVSKKKTTKKVKRKKRR